MGEEGCQEQCKLHGSTPRDQGGNHERNQGICGDALRSNFFLSLGLNQNLKRAGGLFQHTVRLAWDGVRGH